ncbi:MAG: Hsp20/alpha crystallin family protein [Myxococcales bacterium]|nr:Hsp20/alpha crystallin family protein [Myxococcales bacterium]
MLARWDLFSEMPRLNEEVNRLFGQNNRTSGFSPAVDIFEDKEAVYLKAELPGVKPEDIKVDVENRILTLRGERKFENEEKRDGYHRVERAYGGFTRSFSLPESVNTEKTEASLKDGILTLRLAKKPEVQPRQISVKVG